MELISDQEFIKFYNRIGGIRFTPDQEKELYELFKQKVGKYKSIRTNKNKHLHLDKTTSIELDHMIIDGCSQRECCSKFGISRTTFKRHRDKLRYKYGIAIGTKNYDENNLDDLYIDNDDLYWFGCK